MAETAGVWFDGVDKKLIETHSRTTLIEGNEASLITKTPLESYSYYAKCKANYKRKKDKNNRLCSEEERSSNKNGKSVQEDGGEAKTKKVQVKDTIKPSTGITDEIALDCEMVECYHHKSVLARVSIVNLFGHTLLDRYVAPPSKVTDYRTRYSGIRRKDLDNASDFDTVQQEVSNIIKGRIVVGHAVHNDFSVLKINHPQDKIRDTQNYFKFLFQGKTPSLKKLSESVLGLKIQKGEHDSVQDAQATMKLYVKERARWNEIILKGNHHPANQVKKKRQKTKPKKKKVKTFFVMTN